MVYNATHSLKETDMNTPSLGIHLTPTAAQFTAPVATPVIAPYALASDVQNLVKAQAIILVGADKDFANAVSEVATGVARIMGDKPSFDHWTAVQAAFVASYKEVRECEEETARKRFSFVAQAMKDTFALEKPAKPTKAGEVKAAQREGAAKTAADMIEASGAKTAQEVLALSSDTTNGPVAAPVVSALAKLAGDMAKDAGKAANEAAREETKALREAIRKTCANLSLVALRKVAELVANLDAVEHPKPVQGDTNTEAEQEETADTN